MRNFFLFLLVIIFIFQCEQLFAKSAILLKIKSAITPSTNSIIENCIKYSEDQNAEILIIQLNTPGGLLESTRDIVQKIFQSKVPVVVWVAPSGARAGSAGVFLTLSAHIAAMAPGTNIGAAHPVGLGGGTDSSVMNDKIVNDASAFIRSIAQKRNRNVRWAERSVRESISATETEALENGVIDLVAPNIDSLLRGIDKREIETSSGKRTIDVKNVKVEEFKISWRERLLNLISDPNIAYILLIIGIYGIFFELYNPGSIFPGVIGAICLILAIYSLQMLPINIAGIALIVLAIILFLLEIKVVSYGLLTIAGIISLFLGSILLIESPNEFMKISLSVILTIVVTTFLFFTFVITLGIKAQFRTKKLGFEEMIGKVGIVIEKIYPNEKGKIKVMGEIWNATSDQEIDLGNQVVIHEIKDFTLFVKPK
ncbi:MAG: NfeD family protein [Candidatus Kapaibacteriales bacterium]